MATRRYATRNQVNDANIFVNFLCLLLTPSEIYGRNGATPIFRSFHRTASSNTGSWSSWNILMCFTKVNDYGHTFTNAEVIDAVKRCGNRKFFCSRQDQQIGPKAMEYHTVLYNDSVSTWWIPAKLE